MRYPFWLCGLLLVAGCGGDVPGGAAADEPRPLATAQAWQSMPREGVDLDAGDSTLLVTVGPHAVAWPADAKPLEPPYTVSARFHKRRGRIHEGYGLVFGGDPLAAPESEQAYSYFLIRGDGSFLIRRREGEQVPIIRGWTTHAALARDTEEGGRPNELRVEVGPRETVFQANGAELARVPTSELRVRGLAGFRVAHDVELEVTHFSIEPGGGTESDG